MKIGPIVQQIAVRALVTHARLAAGAGVPLLLALEITGRTGGNVVIEEAMESVVTSVQARRNDRRADRAVSDLPGDGDAHGRRR